MKKIIIVIASVVIFGSVTYGLLFNDRAETIFQYSEIFSSSLGVINLDYPGNTTFSVSIRKNCGCDTFNILINGTRIKSVPIDGLQNFSLSKAELSGLGFLFSGIGSKPLTLEIQCKKLRQNYTNWKSIFRTEEKVSTPIQVVKNGEEYTALIRSSFYQPIDEFGPEEMKEVSICCNPHLRIVIINPKIKIVRPNNSENIYMEVTVKVNNKLITMEFLVPKRPDYTWAEKEKNYYNGIIEKFTLDGSDNPDGCKQFGIQVSGEIHTFQKFKAFSLMPDMPVGESWYIKVANEGELKAFDFEPGPSSACPPNKKVKK